MSPSTNSTEVTANADDSLPVLEPFLHQNATETQKRAEHKRTEGLHNDGSPYNEDRKLKRPRRENGRLIPRRERIHRPVIGRRKVERCYILPLGLDYKVPEYQYREYKPCPHQPTFAQRRLRSPQFKAVTPYVWRPYGLTEHNYGYYSWHSSQADRASVPASSSPQKESQTRNPHTASQPVRENPEKQVIALHEVQEKPRELKKFPVGGVAVLPPILGAKSEPRYETPERHPLPKPASSQGIIQWPMPHKFASNGMYIEREYRCTQSHYPRYREYRSPKGLPYREYNYQLVYLTGQSPGHVIQIRHKERERVKRATPLKTNNPAPLPVVAPVVAPVVFEPHDHKAEKPIPREVEEDAIPKKEDKELIPESPPPPEPGEREREKSASPQPVPTPPPPPFIVPATVVKGRESSPEAKTATPSPAPRSPIISQSPAAQTPAAVPSETSSAVRPAAVPSQTSSAVRPAAAAIIGGTAVAASTTAPTSLKPNRSTATTESVPASNRPAAETTAATAASNTASTTVPVPSKAASTTAVSTAPSAIVAATAATAVSETTSKTGTAAMNAEPASNQHNPESTERTQPPPTPSRPSQPPSLPAPQVAAIAPASVAAPVIAARVAPAAAAPPPPQRLNHPAQVREDVGMSGALGTIQRSILIFG